MLFRSDNEIIQSDNPEDMHNLRDFNINAYLNDYLKAGMESNSTEVDQFQLLSKNDPRK